MVQDGAGKPGTTQTQTDHDDMVVLAKLWTFIGQIYIPIALVWGFFVRGGTPGHFERSVLISWGYWGLLFALAVGATLVFIAALYVQKARRRGDGISVPPNTMFGPEAARNRYVVWGTAIFFVLSLTGGLIVFGDRYSDSHIHRWNEVSAVKNGFWSSRVTAHHEGCEHATCYAMAQRMFPGGPMKGVNQYYLYLTDVVLATLIAGLLCSIGFFIFVCLAPTGTSFADRPKTVLNVE